MLILRNLLSLFFILFFLGFLNLRFITLTLFILMIWCRSHSFYLLNIWLCHSLLSLIQLVFSLFFFTISNYHRLIFFQFLFLICFFLSSSLLLIEPFLFCCFSSSYRVWTHNQFRFCLIDNRLWIFKNLIQTVPIRLLRLSVKIHRFGSHLLLLNFHCLHFQLLKLNFSFSCFFHKLIFFCLQKTFFILWILRKLSCIDTSLVNFLQVWLISFTI